MEETEILRQELEQYRNEKERIRRIIGQIGGKRSRKKEQVINIVFILVVALLFGFDVLREKLHITIIDIPTIVSIELAVFLVSLKIIWMIHRQTKVEHFQFWILNSIEFQINMLSQKLKEIESRLK